MAARGRGAQAVRIVLGAVVIAATPTLWRSFSDQADRVRRWHRP